MRFYSYNWSAPLKYDYLHMRLFTIFQHGIDIIIWGTYFYRAGIEQFWVLNQFWTILISPVIRFYIIVLSNIKSQELSLGVANRSIFYINGRVMLSRLSIHLENAILSSIHYSKVHSLTSMEPTGESFQCFIQLRSPTCHSLLNNCFVKYKITGAFVGCCQSFHILCKLLGNVVWLVYTFRWFNTLSSILYSKVNSPTAMEPTGESLQCFI